MLVVVTSAWIAVGAQRAGPVPDEVVLFAENLMVPMRDGVRLATDVYRPARGGVPLEDKFPLLLHRTGYNKKGAGLVRQARTFAAHGYVVAVQDDRGTYKSEGVQGPIVVRLFVSSSAVDTDFTAKLVDVYSPSRDFPSGFAMNLTDGIVRARYRNTPDRAELMKPGVVYELAIEPFPTANVFKKGHRIRVDISSSNFPRFDVNPNTGELLGLNRRTVVADNSVWHDREHPSHIVLPVVRTSRESDK